MDSQDLATPEMIELDGQSGGRLIPWTEADKGRSDAQFHWLQMNHLEEGAEQVLLDDLDVDALVARILLEYETRPRVTQLGEHVILILRGANLQEGAQAESTVSLRVKVNAARGITLSRHKLKTAMDLERAIETGQGPENAASFLIAVIRSLLDNLAPVITRLSEDLDEVEDNVLDPDLPTEEAPLSHARRRIVSLRRYLAPQLDALRGLDKIKVGWLGENHYLLVREEAARMARMVADMDALRERGQMIQEEVTYQLSKRINRNTFILTLAAGVLLPLNLVTGAFGMNVGGIPGAQWPWMFASLMGFFVFFVLGAVLFAYRRKLL